MRAETLSKINPATIYSKQELADLLSFSWYELYHAVATPDGLKYTFKPGSHQPCFLGSEVIRFFSKDLQLCQDGCQYMKTT